MRWSRIFTGSANIAKWWFRGRQPVDKAHAQRRANTCNSPCPLNQPDELYEELTDVAAQLAKGAFRLKGKLVLEVKGEEKLQTCDACGCILKLKVWMDLKSVLESMTPEQQEKLWEKCWIRKEMQNVR